jgi:hypothetical protein
MGSECGAGRSIAVSEKFALDLLRRRITADDHDERPAKRRLAAGKHCN